MTHPFKSHEKFDAKPSFVRFTVYTQASKDPLGFVYKTIRDEWRGYSYATKTIMGPFSTRAAAIAWVHLANKE
jgi:hypothetical protein